MFGGTNISAPCAPAVNMWTTDITLKLTEDFTLYAMFVGPEYHVHIKIEITKSDGMASLAVKYSVTVNELDKKLHALKSQFRRDIDCLEILNVYVKLVKESPLARKRRVAASLTDGETDCLNLVLSFDISPPII